MTRNERRRELMAEAYILLAQLWLSAETFDESRNWEIRLSMMRLDLNRIDNVIRQEKLDGQRTRPGVEEYHQGNGTGHVCQTGFSFGLPDVRVATVVREVPCDGTDSDEAEGHPPNRADSQTPDWWNEPYNS